MLIKPDCPKLQYCGRIEEYEAAPVMVFPCSFVKIKFTGQKLAVILENHQAYWDNYMGYILDGEQGRILLAQSGKQKYEIELEGPVQEHEFMLFKRMDACHHVTFYGFELEKARCSICRNRRSVKSKCMGTVFQPGKCQRRFLMWEKRIRSITGNILTAGILMRG